MTCPFCGVVTEVPHETQDACIDALNAEIGRLRSLLHRLEPLVPSNLPQSDDESPVVPPPA